MGQVISHMTVSLDGYIAQPDDQVAELFEWYGAGEVEMTTANPDVSFRLDEASAEMMRELLGAAGALISGRRLFDQTDGWGDRHPAGPPVVVVTHSPPPDVERWPRTSFVDGVEAAVALARETAGDLDVIIASPTIIQQALDLGLLDEVCLSVVPVLFGEGISYFGPLGGGHVLLDDPVVIEGTRALHLRYRVRRG